MIIKSINGFHFTTLKCLKKRKLRIENGVFYLVRYNTIGICLKYLLLSSSTITKLR